jgi:2-C-methyl-D-erythritol 4-phosphate cytidylyltransferase
VQTPQIFRYDLLKRALDSVEGDFTDDCALVEAIGGKIAIVRGNRTNIKITYPEDIILAEAILKSRKAE